MTVLEPLEKEQCPNCGSSDTYYEVGFLICRTCSQGCRTPTSILNDKKQSLRGEKGGRGKLVGILKVVLLIPVPLVISALLIYTILFAGVGKNTSIMLAIISVALIITALIAIGLNSKKCEECGKWNAMRRFSRKEIERKEVTLRETLKEVHRNKKGQVIETVEKEALVPGVRVYYRVNDKCKFCGHVKISVESDLN